MAEVVEQIDWSLLASKPSDQVSLERLFVLVMAVLCLENENDTAALYIGMIAECSEQYKSTLSQFLENKVFKLLDEKGEQHLSPHENKNFTSDMEWSAVKSTTSVPRDEVNQLVEEIKACNKTIGRLESELHEAVERLEIENERSRELQDQLEIRESEISRLTDELSHATEAVCSSQPRT
jgi:chromosome segregation ATPase